MKIRFASILAAGAVALSSLAVAPAANAVPSPGLIIFSQGAVQNPSNNTVYGHAVSLDTADHSALPPGTTVTVSYASCGQGIQSATYALDDYADGSPNGTVAFLHYFSGTGAPEPMGNAYTNKIGPVLDWSATVYAPGYDPATVGNSYSGYTVKRPSCAEILGQVPSTGKSLVVKEWSTKVKGANVAKVGRKVRITKTVSNGSESYKWYAGKKAVGKGLKIRLKQKYKGKALKVVVVASKGNEAKSKTLRFGRVKR